MTQNYTINSTKAYHTGNLQTLGWELTLCNALYPDNTPIRELLVQNDTFGNLLYDYLTRLIPMERVKKVLEVGGGYGYLMKDFLGRNRSLMACMIDISPVLLKKQRETLGSFSVDFREEDFLETPAADLAGFDLAIMNENLGDFPTLINLDTRILSNRVDDRDRVLKRAIEIFEKYGLEKPLGETFNLNIGAIEALEKLCSAKIPYIYVGENSCEASVTGELRSLLQLKPTGNPERISLAGHDEYTIKFSYLEKVATYHGYRPIRGPFADFIPIALTDEARYALTYGGHYSDKAEIMSQFVEDLYRYEYLVLSTEENHQ